MWIRSQDKRQLLNVNDIRVQGCFINSEEKMANLGKYSSQEKALKVMDMIEQNIKNSFVAKTDYSEQYSENSRRGMGVFQMPQDSEVE